MTGSLEKKRSGKRTPPSLFFLSLFHFYLSCLSVSLSRLCVPSLPPLPSSLFYLASLLSLRPPSFLLPPPSSLLPLPSFLLLPPLSSLLPPPSSLPASSLLPPTYSLDSKCHIPMVPLRSHWISKCHIEATCKCYLLTFNVKWSHANVCLMWHL